MMHVWSCLLAALLAFPLTAHAGDIRKWVDAEGRVHFGDDAAATGPSEAVRVSPGNFLATTRAGAARAATPAVATSTDLMSRALPADPAPAAAAPAATTATAAAGTPDCPPVEYKKISPKTGLVMRMRRFPCQPGLAPQELGPL